MIEPRNSETPQTEREGGIVNLEASESSSLKVAHPDKISAFALIEQGWVAGIAALASMVAIVFAIIPVFGRISAGQAWAFKMAGYYILTPIVMATAIAMLFKARGSQKSEPGFQRSPRVGGFTFIDATVITWFLVQVLSVLASSWDLAANFQHDLAVLAFYAAWRLGIPALRGWRKIPGDGDDSSKAASASIPGVVAWSLAALGGLFALQAILIGFGFNLFAVFNKSLTDNVARGGVLTFLGHPNYLGSTLALLFFLKLGLLFGRDSGKSSPAVSVILWPLLALDLAALFMIGARGATLSVIAGCVIAGAMAFLQKAMTPRSRRALLGVVAVLLVGLFALLGYAWRQGSQRSATNKAEITLSRSSLATRLFSRGEGTTRLQTYLSSLAMALEKPLLGQGAGSYDVAYWDLLARHLEAREQGDGADAPPIPMLADDFLMREIAGLNPGHTHNEILHAAAETGALGVLALLLLGAAAFAEAWRSRSIFLAGALTAFAVDSQFNFPFHLPISSILVTVILAALAGGAARRSADNAELSTSGNFAGGAFTASILAATLLAGWAVSPGALWGQLSSRYSQIRSARQETPEAAFAMLERAALQDPANLEARRAIVDGHLASGRARKSLNEADRLVAQSRHPFDRFREAEARLQTGSEFEAARTFDLVCRMVPRHQPTAERRLRAVLQTYIEAKARPQWLDRQKVAYLVASITRAVDHLRMLDYNHPLTNYAEGVLAWDAGALNPALRNFRTALEELRRRADDPEILNPAEQALADELQNQIEALLAARSRAGQ